MYSDERSEKSTGTTAAMLDLPWRMRIVVRVRSFSISWTSRSGIASCSKQACSYTRRARDTPSAASTAPGANRSPP